MIKITLDENKKTTIEMEGTGESLIEEALNVVGHLFKAIEREIPSAAPLFLMGIPIAIENFIENDDYDKSEVKPDAENEKEESHENDAL